MEYEPLGTEDRITAERQLGRLVRGDARVAARCSYGVVEVIATPPLLPDGTPFPTLYWLSCPLLQRNVSGLESGDLRDLLKSKLEEEPGFRGVAAARGEGVYRYQGEMGRGDCKLPRGPRDTSRGARG